MMLVDSLQMRVPPLLHLPADVTFSPSVPGNFEFQLLFLMIKLPLMQKKNPMNRVTSSVTEKSTSYGLTCQLVPSRSYSYLYT